MKKFLIVYHASASAAEQMAKATPAQAKAGMDMWMSWAKACGPALVDLGTPLAHGKSLTPKGTAASTKEVCGYSVMQADSMETVLGMLKKHPHFGTPGQCSIEVHEALALPGM
jgi:hypothetical protein